MLWLNYQVVGVSPQAWRWWYVQKSWILLPNRLFENSLWYFNTYLPWCVSQSTAKTCQSEISHTHNFKAPCYGRGGGGIKKCYDLHCPYAWVCPYTVLPAVLTLWLDVAELQTANLHLHLYSHQGSFGNVLSVSACMNLAHTFPLRIRTWSVSIIGTRSILLLFLFQNFRCIWLLGEQTWFLAKITFVTALS